MVFTVAVAGASGYAGGELLRLLDNHPEFEVRTVTGHSNAGAPLMSVHPHLRGYPHLTLAATDAEILSGHDVVFLALPHGASGELTDRLHDDTLIVDCGADHRLESEADWAAFYGGEFYGAWTYGVPELPLVTGTQREHLAAARRIAAPGCNASTVALALAPGIRAGVIEPHDLVAVLAVGPSGAGRALKTNLLAGEILGSANPYSVGGTHRHIPEILQSLRRAGALEPRISFIPVIVPMSRGILATCSARLAPGADAASVRQAYEDAYASETFVHVLPDGQVPRSSDVLGANTALLGVDVDDAAGRVTVIAAVDNLVKGTAGAAIQSANLALGIPESTGLSMNGVAP